MALTQLKTGAIADDAVTEAKVANDAISPAEMKAGTDGHIITYDASGNPTTVGPGTDGQVLTSTGAGSPPAFETPAAGVGGATGVDFNDDVKIRSGTGNDLEIYHDASNSYITNTTGNLIVKDTTGQIFLQSTVVNIESEDGETQAKFTADGSSELYYDNAKKFETLSTGVRAQGGIAFGSDTAAANHLDDYEEGTWTPGLAFGGGTTSLTLSEAVGNYTKIGHMVYVNAAITVSNKGSSSGAATVTGLPFTNTTNNGDRINGGFNYIAAFNGLTTVPILYSGSSGTTIEIYQADANSGSITQITSVTNAYFNTNNATIRLWAIYRV